MQVSPWEIAGVAVGKGVRRIVRLNDEAGLYIGTEDLAQQARWQLPSKVVQRLGFHELFQGSMAAAPAEAQSTVLQSLLASAVECPEMAASFPATISLVTAAGDILMTSRQAFPGAPPSQVIGSTVFDWLPSERHDVVRWMYQQSEQGRWFEGVDHVQTEAGLFAARIYCGPASSGRVIVLNLPPRQIDEGSIAPPPQLLAF